MGCQAASLTRQAGCQPGFCRLPRKPNCSRLLPRLAVASAKAAKTMADESPKAQISDGNAACVVNALRTTRSTLHSLNRLPSWHAGAKRRSSVLIQSLTSLSIFLINCKNSVDTCPTFQIKAWSTSKSF